MCQNALINTNNQYLKDSPPSLELLTTFGRQTINTQVTVYPESFIDFWCYPGATVENRLDCLRRSLASHLQKLHHITLFVWILGFTKSP
jgi:hypothetical protein